MNPVRSLRSIGAAVALGALAFSTSAAAPEVSQAAPAFADDFESGGLSQWTGKNGGPHSGQIVPDPRNPGNHVLNFSQVIGSGDVFSQVITTSVPHIVQFDYLGNVGSGGCIGYNPGTGLVAGSRTGAVWAYCDDPNYNSGHQSPAGAPATWKSCQFPLPTGVHRLMAEDFRGTPLDAIFDNIQVIPGDGARGCIESDPTVGTDADLDGLGDNVDNCPTTANADQADLDGDGEGDACDDDVDGDASANDVDNCPTTANGDQADLDGDGQGDACDDDVDGDGVANDADAYPRSDTGSTVTVAGCEPGVGNVMQPTGASFNDELAAAAAGAANHGDYVSSVSSLSNGWKKAKLISGRNHGAIVSCAARSDVGKG